MTESTRDTTSGAILFDGQEDLVLLSAARWMRFTAIFLIIVGAIPVLLLAFVVLTHVVCNARWSGFDPTSAWIVTVLAGVLGVALVRQGMSLQRAAEELREAVADYGEAVFHLSSAIGSFRVYLILEVLFGVFASALTLWGWL